MPDFRFVCAKPTTQPASGYAVRITQETWSKYEDLIRRFHSCGATRDEILRTLINDHGFQPSTGQLRDQLARWGLRSNRKSRTCASSEQGNGSGTSSGSDTLRETRQDVLSLRPQNAYITISDDFFSNIWSHLEMGTLHLRKAVEMEMLAEMLFLSGRYVAAFNLYFLLYHALVLGHGANTECVMLRFRAFTGCLRSCGSTEQRLRVVRIAEQELQNCFFETYCIPRETDVRHHWSFSRYHLMAQFHERENFRSIMSTLGGPNISAAVAVFQVEEEDRATILRWCFDRLNTNEFMCLYSNQVQQTGSIWNSGGPQPIIFWFLIVEAAKYPDQDFACLKVRQASGYIYTFTILETLALVAAMVSAEPWLFSFQNLPPEGLQKWTDKLTNDRTLFDSAFKQALRTTLLPTLELRITRTDLNKTASSSGLSSCRMPEISLLESFAAKLSQRGTTEMSYNNSHQAGQYQTASPSSSDSFSFASLTHQYSAIIKVYISENYAHNTSYQLPECNSERPLNNPTSKGPMASKNGSRSSSTRPPPVDSQDPTLSSAAYDSDSGSFGSFEMTHERTKSGTWPSWQSDSMDLDSSGTSDSSRLFLSSIGVR